MGIFDFFSKRTKTEKAKSSFQNTPEISEEVKVVVNEEVEEVNTYSKVFKHNFSEISITDFNKEINSLYKESGLEKSEMQLNIFWEENNESFDLIDAHRCVNNFINILKKEKLSSNEISDFIDSKISDFPDSMNYDYSIPKAKMLKKFDLEKALDYLELVNNKEEGQIKNRELFIQTICLESEYLLKNKNYDKAFRNLGRVSLILPNLTQFEYLRWSKDIAYLRAKICFSEQKPKYDGFLFYEISAFLFDVLVSLSSFPHSFLFFGWKKEYKESLISNNWPFDSNKNFEKAILELNMSEFNSEMMLELREFAFFTLPEIYGLPKEYDTNEKIKNVTDRISKEYQGWKRLMKISETLQSKMADEEVVAVFEFVQNLVKKYHEKSNQT